MVYLKPPITPNNSNTSEQSNSPSSLSLTSPHLLYLPPSSTSFTPFHFQEAMPFPPFLYYSYNYYPPPFHLYISAINFTVPSFQPPPSPPYYGGSQPVATDNSVVANTHEGGVILEVPDTSGTCNGRRFMRRKHRRLKKEWRPRQKVKHANGSHPSPPSHPLLLPPNSGHLVKCTTLMVKNIPNFISRRTMIDMLDCHCREQNHKAAYDFLYLPFDFEHKQNLGYAFVNFTSEEGASTLGVCWNGKGWSVSTKKIRQICPAKVQGLEMCKNHFKDTQFRCRSEEFLPVEFSPPRNGLNGSTSTMATIGIWLSLNSKKWKLKTVNPPRLRH